jgi:hypothetical protein
MRPVRKTRRATLKERVQLWASESRIVDGLWVGAQEIGDDTGPALDRVEAALCLIKTHDRLRYDRLLRDLERVWVAVLPGTLGVYNEALKACELDPRHVLDEDASAEMIAATIVHEATHARLHGAGIAYDEAQRARIEAVCARRELAFARKLPNGERVRRGAEYLLDMCASPDSWNDVSLEARYADGIAEALHYIGMPEWLVRISLRLRALRQRIRRLKRKPERL